MHPWKRRKPGILDRIPGDVSTRARPAVRSGTPPYGVTGNAARRLNAPLELINYEDIGERRVYTFEMITTIPEEMPEVANFLRAVAEGTLPQDSTATVDRGPLQVNPSEAARASD